MTNKIFHLDMDCFFASIEILKNKNLKNLPIAVGQKMKEGVVSSSNYIARSLGVKAAMPIYKAKKICPQLIVVDSDMKKYIDISNEIDSLLRSIIPNVEKGSIDEWYIDVKKSYFENWDEKKFGFYLKKLIKNKFGLDCSIGNSFTIFLAKTATNLCKPNGFLTLDKNNFKDYLLNVKIENLFGIGNQTLSVLKNDFNIHSVLDLYNTKNDVLIKKKLGTSWNKLIFNINGIEINKVNFANKKKNIGKSSNIRDFYEYNEFLNLFNSMVKDINMTLKKDNLFFKSFNLKFKISKQKYISKSFFYSEHTNKIKLNDVVKIFENIVSINEYKNISNVSITVSNLLNKNYFKEQKNIFDFEKNKKIQIEEIIIEKINSKFDKKVLYRMKKNQHD